MNDTEITVVGNVLTEPERREIEKTNAVVTTFRIVSNSRRFDRDTGQWTDGALFRIRVNCWRRLAHHVYNSVKVGDPVIVKGRITTREWKTEQGEPRSAYEIDATNVGHDLARGTSQFARYKADPPVVEDADFENRVNGELTRLLDSSSDTGEINPDGFDDFPFAEFDAGADEPPAAPVTGSEEAAVAGDTHADAVSILREAGLEPREPDGGEGSADDAASGLVAAGSGGRSRKRGR
ncbi:MAG TPA: single-stranded DNA-binding protein [Micromonosporaceae bacterium]|nr:single-stranded DNA-binding protein [Micromonosporaceae bacterium]